MSVGGTGTSRKRFILFQNKSLINRQSEPPLKICISSLMNKRMRKITSVRPCELPVVLNNGIMLL